jgi:hypothetical protein
VKDQQVNPTKGVVKPLVVNTYLWRKLTASIVKSQTGDIAQAVGHLAKNRQENSQAVEEINTVGPSLLLIEGCISTSSFLFFFFFPFFFPIFEARSCCGSKAGLEFARCRHEPLYLSRSSIL